MVKSLSLDGDNVLSENGDAILLEFTETVQVGMQFRKNGVNSPVLKSLRRNRVGKKSY